MHPVDSLTYFPYHPCSWEKNLGQLTRSSKTEPFCPCLIIPHFPASTFYLILLPTTAFCPNILLPLILHLLLFIVHSYLSALSPVSWLAWFSSLWFAAFSAQYSSVPTSILLLPDITFLL